tara:strand:+ start:67 stop:870 length:804 start_codon:yes stop_codon:yes gene_type:complete
MSDISINSNISSNLFTDNYQYPEWFNKKKYIFYNKILERLQRLSYLHTRASQHYEKMNYYIFGPSITITALSGIASFLSTSQYISEGAQNGFGIGVGVVASVSSVLQSLAGACQFSAKTEAHRNVAEQYNNLIISVKFEIEMPNEEDFTDKLENQILDIQSKCNYFVPQFIVEEYEKSRKDKKLKRTGGHHTGHTGGPSFTTTSTHTEKDHLVLNIEEKGYNTFGGQSQGQIVADTLENGEINEPSNNDDQVDIDVPENVSDNSTEV